MAIDKTGGSKPQIQRQPEPKPAAPPAPPRNTATGTPATTRNAATGTPATPARPQTARPPSDGFDRGTAPSSAQRNQQQAKLGSTTAATQTQAPTADQNRNVLDKLGLTTEDVRKAGSEALPHLQRAAESVVQGRPEEAIGHLRSAAFASPEVAQKAIKGLAQNLPEGTAKTLLTNDAVVKQLVTNSDLHASVGKLLQNPADTTALRELVSNDSARDAVLGALGNDPTVKAQLDKVGLTPQDLVEVGAAAPHVLDAIEKISAGDVKGGLESIQGAIEAAPELAGKIGGKLVDALPQGVKDQIAKLGITEQQLRDAGPALPHLYAAADAASKGNWGEAFNSLKEAAVTAKDLSTQALKGLAQQLPAELGAVKTLLTDDAFLSQVVSNGDLHDQVGKLFNPETRLEGLRGLLDNAPVRDAALKAIGNDPGVKAQLANVGLTPQDLVEAGAAAPRLLEAFEKIKAGDVKGGLESIQTAIEAAPELAGKIGQKLLDAVPQGVKDQIAKLGITEQQLRDAGPALPHLFQAAQSASEGKWGEAFDSLKEAAITAKDLSKQALKGLAQQLPAEMGAVKTLLTDDAFLSQVVSNRDLHDQVGKLFNPETRMEGLRGLLDNAPVRDAALKAIGNDPGVKAQLANVGLTPQDLVEAGAAAPRLLEAFEKIKAGDVKGGLESIQTAIEAAPELAGKIGQKLLDAVPQGVKDQIAKLGITEQQLRDAGPALPHLFQAAQSASEGKWGEAFDSLKEAAITAKDLSKQALKGLAQQLPAEMGAVKTLLTDDAFLSQVVSNRDLHDQVGKLFNPETRMEGLRGLLGNDAARDAALKAVGNDPGVTELLGKAGLTPQDLVEAGAAAPHLFDSVQAFANGDIDAGIAALGKAAEAAPQLLDKIGQKIVAQLPEGLRNSISELGITPSDLLQAGKALPDLLRAGQALGQGDFRVALSSLRDAAGKIPPALIEKAITTTAAKLPEVGDSGMIRSMLTDPAFVHELVTNKDVHASFTKMMNGEFIQGAKELLGNDKLREAAGNALAKNADFMEKLRPFGIQSGADIAALGGAAFDVLQAAGQLAEGKPGEALHTLGKALGDVPPELRGRMVGALADKLGVPDWARDTLTAVASLLGNEDVGKAMGDAFAALKRGDVPGFLAGIATTGKAICETAPEAAKAFLNSLGKIPGSLGKLFQDRELNAAVVDSGAATNLFEAAEKLGRGDVGGAMAEIAEAGGALLTQGEHFKVAGQELPFGQQGIENLSRMFGRFVDALPEKLKTKIAEESAKMAARAGLQSVPFIGNVVSGVSAVGSAKDLWDAIQADPKDALDIALAAGQLGLDVAGVFPGLNSITGPLKVVLGTAKVVKGASDLIGDITEFQRSLVA
ncbi:hypothetical protein [Archangium primigenium]|uniref:hypothetical protein n=1 Tax=[Archangium] primigenium TaxID=2792470 RepID=UPI00195B8C85|nr:hypothetical protein [Archangium primigenium]MBM7113033.1 hypothetical protein [Archangium primigenium]